MANPNLKLPKKLIVLCDRTWQISDDQAQVPTNVTRMARAIRPENGMQHPQIVYYQNGVGSESFSWLDHLLGGEWEIPPRT